LEERLREISGDDVLEGLNDNSAGRGDAAVEIQDCGMDALPGLEAEIAIGDLHGDRDEDGVARHAKKISPIVHVDFVTDNADGHQLGEIFEAFGGRWTRK